MKKKIGWEKEDKMKKTGKNYKNRPMCGQYRESPRSIPPLPLPSTNTCMYLK